MFELCLLSLTPKVCHSVSQSPKTVVVLFLKANVEKQRDGGTFRERNDLEMAI